MSNNLYGITTSIINVTPSLAENWLRHNTRNRKATKSTVKAYAEDMLNGKWEVTSQGISFYEDGVLADGQHRLLAIVEAGVTVPMMVTHGLPKSAINGIDQHRIRRVGDVLTMKQEYGQVSSTDVATLRLLYPFSKRTASQVEAMLKESFEELQIVSSLFGSAHTKTGSAVFRAAVLLALKAGVPKEELEEFVRVLITGVAEKPYHKAIIYIRDDVMSGKMKGGDSMRRQHMKRVQHAISKFLDRQEVKLLRTPTHFTYPLLDESDLFHSR